MLRVLLDATNVSSNPTGAGLFAQHISRELVSQNPGKNFTILYRKNLPFAHPLLALPKTQFIACDVPTIGPKRDVILSSTVRSLHGQYDVFLSFMPYLPLWVTPAHPCITIHDLGYLHFPKFFSSPLHRWYFNMVVKRSVARAEHIFTVSNSTKEDILRFFPEAKDKHITIVSEASTLQTAQSSGTPPERPYILYVGERRAHKNIENIIKAFARLAPKHPELDLRIVGKDHRKYTAKLTEVIVQCKLESRVFLSDAGGVGEQELKMLYEHARVLVLVSFYEGFGLPLVEAMQAGVPIVASTADALKEVAGPAALYAEPQAADDIAAKLEQVLFDDQIRQTLITAGVQQLKKYSWQAGAHAFGGVLASYGK